MPRSKKEHSYTSTPPLGLRGLLYVLHGELNVTYTRVMAKYMHIQRSAMETHTAKTIDPDRQQHNSLAACLIAKQYSSATFTSLNFHTLNKIVCSFKILLFIPLFFFLISCLKRAIHSQLN